MAKCMLCVKRITWQQMPNQVQGLMDHVQIADFGLSRVLENNATHISTNTHGEPCISHRTYQ